MNEVKNLDQIRELAKGFDLEDSSGNNWQLVAATDGTLPPLSPRQLGTQAFQTAFNVNYSYMTGSMAHGISGVDFVITAARLGILGSFGAGGLDLIKVDKSLGQIRASVGELSFACNLLHSPDNPLQETGIVRLCGKHGVEIIEASAFFAPTEAILEFKLSGLSLKNGELVSTRKVIAKVSRVEVAEKFMSPPDPKLVQKLLDSGRINQLQARVANQIAVADAVTVEADSAGHTDQRPLLTAFPTISAVKEQLLNKFPHIPVDRIFIGAAGGIGTPEAALAAYSMGADYIVTGSINQATCEASTSDEVKAILANVKQADVKLAPAGDMFEIGAKVQVVKNTSMFAMKATKLYEIYRSRDGLEELTEREIKDLEGRVFQDTISSIWDKTRQYYEAKNKEISWDKKSQMAAVFKWYLGNSHRWAQKGYSQRRGDYQIWCGPAMGAFNEWTRNTYLENPKNRELAKVTMSLLESTCRFKRILQLREITGAYVPSGKLIRPGGPG